MEAEKATVPKNVSPVSYFSKARELCHALGILIKISQA